ncbi:MAG: mono/diheme cytochrome c family protein [bacterium]|mgnify:CR=1 FL=1|jgi:mono/diheme cytochrome c family protein
MCYFYYIQIDLAFLYLYNLNFYMKHFLIFFVLLLAACGNADDPSLRQLHKANSTVDLSAKEIYTKHCVACHQQDALGVTGIFPPLKNSDYFLEDPKRAIHNILFGQNEEITVNGAIYKGLMPPVKITDQEVVQVVNYLLQEVNKVEKEITLKDVLWVRENR